MTGTETPATATSTPTTPAPVEVWGLPLAPLTLEATLDRVDALVAAGRPSYLVTANLYYAMLTDRHPDLDALNRGAALVLADGMPLVWASRYKPGGPLPERVAGSDLIFRLCERAAARGYGVFLLGAAPETAARAARALEERYPGLRVVGVESPYLDRLTPEEEEALTGRVRAARPAILIGAFGQPHGERWIARNLEAMGVPVGVQLGASIDFAAGRVRRAPRWMQRTGLEWFFRMMQEPRRLAPRYAANAAFLARMVGRDLTGRGR
jgi:N-acetylglucosaminyldiphosphoundecaprenol N-acetyl-beta-D-mannosaminyltransferase